ncbi:HTH-type transcriptional regulator LysM [Candidatus Nitrosotenuis cloacae]|jgi:Lrp/AsnC family leucine-responsive transcriptional regulator|uniref:Transcriptional regulator n=1 Tax=Candidatus Nitrosotenuis cloacae TaxID=1603555 RepID=A0A3G1B8B0_9ARCH|nr:HTH-type transcriptional regulator LysM [Candidatus Nitrosotenuis cloacae]AJZ76477.1 transcriptional regulator [Candidatus Nitrosotenuis cloacae]MDG7050423.1 Lrp/AsnC family transcriptional regulator [Nitrososphaerota archaeon]
MHKDSVDDEILRILRDDSRESFVDIGKKLKLSESAVRRRVKNLTDAQIIKKFTIEIGEQNSTKAIVLISVESSMDTSKVSARLTKLDGVKTVYEITGQYDIAVIISSPNITEINLAIDALRKVPGVSDTNTVIILREVT